MCSENSLKPVRQMEYGLAAGPRLNHPSNYPAVWVIKGVVAFICLLYSTLLQSTVHLLLLPDVSFSTLVNRSTLVHHPNLIRPLSQPEAP